MNCDTTNTMFRYSKKIISLKQLIIILVDTMPVTKPDWNTRSNGEHSNAHDLPFLFLQEESRLWRAALVIPKPNLLFTQHHFWARSADEVQCNPRSSQRNPSLWFNGAVYGTWSILARRCLKRVGRKSQTRQAKIQVNIWGGLTEKGYSYISDLGTTVLPCCAPTSLLLRHFIWLYSNFLKKRPSLTPHLCRHPNYNQAPQSH